MQARQSDVEVERHRLESLEAFAMLVLPSLHPAGAFIGQPHVGSTFKSLRPRPAVRMGLPGKPGYRIAKAKQIIGDILLGKETAKELRLDEQQSQKEDVSADEFLKFMAGSADDKDAAVETDLASSVRAASAASENEGFEAQQAAILEAKRSRIGALSRKAQNVKHGIGRTFLGEEAANELRLAELRTPAPKRPPRYGQPGYKRSLTKGALESIVTKRFGAEPLTAKTEEARAEEQAREDWIWKNEVQQERMSVEKAREQALARAEAKGAAAFANAARKSAEQSIKQDREWLKEMAQYLAKVEAGERSHT